MKEEIDDATRTALISYRLEKANETLKEAKLLTDNGFFNAAVNRLYYSCYYAVQALLIKNKISAHTHAGVKTSFGMQFVATGIVPIKIGKTFSTLFEKRQSSDYEDFIMCDKEDAETLTSKAIEFIKTIEELIK